MTPLLELRLLSAGYGQVHVLHEVSLTVDPGEIVVLLGANGAGKTTTLRAVCGMIPSSGQILVDDVIDANPEPARMLAKGIAHVPQGRGTIAEITVEDNLRVGAYTRRDDEVDDDIERFCELFPILGERRRQPAGQLSGGEQQMLAIARAMLSRPRLLLLDEPSLGLAPIIVHSLFDILAELRETSGVAVLLVEQNAALALPMASRAYVLESGRIVQSGSADELMADDSVRRAYLGN